MKVAFEEFKINLLSCGKKVYTEYRYRKKTFSSKLESFLYIVEILNKMPK